MAQTVSAELLQRCVQTAFRTKTVISYQRWEYSLKVDQVNPNYDISQKL